MDQAPHNSVPLTHTEAPLSLAPRSDGSDEGTGEDQELDAAGRLQAFVLNLEQKLVEERNKSDQLKTALTREKASSSAAEQARDTALDNAAAAELGRAAAVQENDVLHEERETMERFYEAAFQRERRKSASADTAWHKAHEHAKNENVELREDFRREKDTVTQQAKTILMLQTCIHDYQTRPQSLERLSSSPRSSSPSSSPSSSSSSSFSSPSFLSAPVDYSRRNPLYASGGISRAGSVARRRPSTYGRAHPAASAASSLGEDNDEGHEEDAECDARSVEEDEDEEGGSLAARRCAKPFRCELRHPATGKFCAKSYKSKSGLWAHNVTVHKKAVKRHTNKKTRATATNEGRFVSAMEDSMIARVDEGEENNMGEGGDDDDDDDDEDAEAEDTRAPGGKRRRSSAESGDEWTARSGDRY